MIVARFGKSGQCGAAIMIVDSVRSALFAVSELSKAAGSAERVAFFL